MAIGTLTTADTLAARFQYLTPIGRPPTAQPAPKDLAKILSAARPKTSRQPRRLGPK